MHRIAICAICLASLAGCTEPPAPDASQLFEPDLVRDWCEFGTAPAITAEGWPECSAVTRGDAERLGAHKRQVAALRAGGRAR